VWGGNDEARQADDDSFHYTNCAPQHEGLNQRTWLSLEDYILDHTQEEDLKVCVFTGPVFGDTDIQYRHARIPGEYWKVVAMVGLDGKLRATGYLLSQTQLLDDIEFAFGRFRTYQVRIREIEKKTGLVFCRLRDNDPLEQVEAVADCVAIEGPSDLVL
jgi:endonuclease G